MGRFDLLFTVATMQAGGCTPAGNREIEEIRRARPETGPAPQRPARGPAPWIAGLAALCVGLGSAEVLYLLRA